MFSKVDQVIKKFFVYSLHEFFQGQNGEIQLF